MISGRASEIRKKFSNFTKIYLAKIIIQIFYMLRNKQFIFKIMLNFYYFLGVFSFRLFFPILILTFNFMSVLFESKTFVGANSLCIYPLLSSVINFIDVKFRYLHMYAISNFCLGIFKISF